MKELIIIDDEKIIDYGIYRDDFQTKVGKQIVVNNWNGNIGESLAFYDSDYNRLSFEELVEKGLIERPIVIEEVEETCEEEKREEVEKIDETQLRKDVIIGELIDIDNESLRPLRAILCNNATDYDREKLAELEKRAKTLREELCNLK